ncbi:DUF1573 domain-containing protein [Seonamhaeicola sediminis]|uniref:DUF1573 domain-containing protein n=1 Tax=Seonamhaeicola sediminis TaxID=2528206 RepID=A0A562YAZ3_9FLAO|nr:DUF1573 domain-containing protein [Seonamhaeicola sediminis]
MRLKILNKIGFFLLILIGCNSDYPEISFSQKIIDIGEIKRDTIIDVSFKFKNIGKEILIIKRITTDCHCTVPKDYVKRIEPNRKGEIKISYHSRGYGYFEQLISVFSNSQKNEELLILKGTVIREN